MEYIKLNAEKREPGKKHTKAVRKNKQIPIEIYGKGLEKNISGSVVRAEYIKALHTKQGKNAVLELDIDGKTIKAITHSFQIHPVKNYIIHADLMVIEENTELVVTVPVSRKGKSKAETVGGRTLQMLKDIKVKCKPMHIPETIKIDISEFNIGDRVSISQLTYPENVSPVFTQDTPVFVFNKGRGQSVEADEEDKEGAAGEGGDVQVEKKVEQ